MPLDGVYLVEQTTDPNIGESYWADYKACVVDLCIRQVEREAPGEVFLFTNDAIEDFYRDCEDALLEIDKFSDIWKSYIIHIKKLLSVCDVIFLKKASLETVRTLYEAVVALEKLKQTKESGKLNSESITDEMRALASDVFGLVTTTNCVVGQIQNEAAGQATSLVDQACSVSSAKVELPAVAPELYADRDKRRIADHEFVPEDVKRKEDVFDFIQRVYGDPWIKALVLTRGYLRELDFQLYTALSNKLRSAKMPEWLRLPLSVSRDVDGIMISPKDLEIHRKVSAYLMRKSYQSKKTKF